MEPQTPPAYILVEQKIVGWLSQGDFTYGDRLPTEHRLMEMFSVSRTTVRRALQLIEAKGIISRSQGSGTFYALKNTDRPQPGAFKTIGIINFFFMDYIYTEIVRGIEEEANRAGYTLFIANSNKDEGRQLEAIRNLIDQNVDGLIIEPKRNIVISEDHPLVELLSNTDIPVVTTHWGVGAKRLSTVSLDDVYAGRLAGKYLIDMGHERIAYICKSDVQASYDRMVGLRSALEEAGLQLDERYVFSYSDDDEAENVLQGYIQTLKLFETCEPTAIFTSTIISRYRAIVPLPS